MLYVHPHTIVLLFLCEQQRAKARGPLVCQWKRGSYCFYSKFGMGLVYIYHAYTYILNFAHCSHTTQADAVQPTCRIN